METITLDLVTLQEINSGLDERVNKRFDSLCACPKWQVFKKRRLQLLFDEAYHCRELVRTPIFNDAIRNLYKKP